MTDSNESTVNPPAPKSKRRPIRLLSIVSLAFSTTVFACAGCLLLMPFVLRSEDFKGPAGANQVAAGITDWTLPEGFTGTSGNLINNAMLRLDLARFAQKQGRGILIIAQLQSKILPIPNQNQRTLELIEQNVPELTKIAPEHREWRTFPIRNLPGRFELIQGEARASTTRYRQVIGDFRGRVDDAVLILQYEEGILTDQEVEDFLKSIK